MSKRRKTQADGAFIKIGGKSISLDGYLGSAKAPAKTADKPSPTVIQEDVSVDRSVRNEQNGKDKPIHESGGIGKQRSPRRDLERKGRGDPGDKALLPARQALPIWNYRDEIRKPLRQNDVLIVVAETGSGKSTQVPQFLCTEGWCQRKTRKIRRQPGGPEEELSVGGMIAITQPRRVAATTLAQRVAREAGTPLGQATNARGLVGYSVRFDHNVPKGTKIKFLTEGMLLQELLRDPSLRQYSAIIVDEIHERSIDVDLLSGFLKLILSGDKAGRDGIPLKVVIMSATANVEAIQSFFSGNTKPNDQNNSKNSTQVDLLQIEGRQFPVDITYTPKAVPDLQESLLKTIFKIHMEQPLPGDILAFLTGQEEIEAAQRLIKEFAATLASNVPRIHALPLFGQLSIEAQQKAFQPAKGKFTRKVVLATNIAETSVTVPGVRYVVDCGKAKVKQFRTRLGMESLLAKPISKSSAIQRAGRAGREAPGKCFRLYTEETYKTLQESDLPEILRIDVLGAVLTMKARGIDDIFSFPLMDTPDVESFEKALLHLHILGALADDGSITEMGRKMALFPVSAPYGRVLLAAAEPEFDCLLEVIDIISCITAGEDLFHQLQTEEAREEAEEYRKELYRREGDLLTYLTTIQHYVAENTDRKEWCKRRKINTRNMRQALNIRKQLRGMCLKEKMLSEPPPADPQPFTPISPDRAEIVLKCFLKGFSMRTAVLAPDGSYVTSHGKHVVAIHPSSVLHGQKREAIMFLEHVFTQKNYAKKVSVIQANWILEAF
ncbi:Helicase associated domain-containing protein [Pleurostoma richardsiae]|uniref:RNA helicase n=1 Tax=Pleurostoma richardsiae TaxID=41990 RepID=A0AA38S7X8_9PEZI|nr:Helicase associated domain-containing protein [Pleurostoma richardsiae]